MATIEVKCPICKLNQVIKFGLNLQGKQKYRCHNEACYKDTFILYYKNKGHLPEIKNQIIEMALNGSGIRDTSRVLGISQNTVINELKKKKLKSKM